MFTRITTFEPPASTVSGAGAPLSAWSRGLTAAGLFMLAMSASVHAQDASPGVVRIADAAPAPAPIPESSSRSMSAGAAAPNGPVLELTGNAAIDWYRTARFERRLDRQAQAEADGCPDSQCDGWCHGCFGFCHCCDGGSRCHFLDARCYSMVYPYNPWYFDRRDAQVYAAQGYGAPMTVPLAPNVTNQWNYGWGVPSSRLTPISRVAPRPGVIEGAVPPQ